MENTIQKKKLEFNYKVENEEIEEDKINMWNSAKIMKYIRWKGQFYMKTNETDSIDMNQQRAALLLFSLLVVVEEKIGN